jgi:hypothetical protein
MNSATGFVCATSISVRILPPGGKLKVPNAYCTLHTVTLCTVFTYNTKETRPWNKNSKEDRAFLLSLSLANSAVMAASLIS